MTDERGCQLALGALDGCAAVEKGEYWSPPPVADRSRSHIVAPRSGVEMFGLVSSSRSLRLCSESNFGGAQCRVGGPVRTCSGVLIRITRSSRSSCAQKLVLEVVFVRYIHSKKIGREEERAGAER